MFALFSLFGMWFHSLGANDGRKKTLNRRDNMCRLSTHTEIFNQKMMTLIFSFGIAVCGREHLFHSISNNNNNNYRFLSFSITLKTHLFNAKLKLFFISFQKNFGLKRKSLCGKWKDERDIVINFRLIL